MAGINLATQDAEPDRRSRLRRQYEHESCGNHDKQSLNHLRNHENSPGECESEAILLRRKMARICRLRKCGLPISALEGERTAHEVVAHRKEDRQNVQNSARWPVSFLWTCLRCRHRARRAGLSQ